MQNTLTPHQMGKLAHFLGVANNFKHHLKTTSRHHTFKYFQRISWVCRSPTMLVQPLTDSFI